MLLFEHFAFDLNNIGEVWHLEDVVVFSLILSFSSFLDGNWAKISSDDVKKKKKKKRRSNTNHFYRKMHKHSQAGSPVMLNWVAFSSCNRWSSSLRPPPSSDEEEKAGGGSTARGERGLHTVLHDSSQQQEDVRHPWVTTFLKLFFSFHRWSEDTLTIQQAGDNSHSLMMISEPNTDNWS